MTHKDKITLWILIDDLYEAIPKSRRSLPPVSNVLSKAWKLLLAPRPEIVPSPAAGKRPFARGRVQGKARAASKVNR